MVSEHIKGLFYFSLTLFMMRMGSARWASGMEKLYLRFAKRDEQQQTWCSRSANTIPFDVSKEENLRASSTRKEHERENKNKYTK